MFTSSSGTGSKVVPPSGWSLAHSKKGISRNSHKKHSFTRFTENENVCDNRSRLSQPSSAMSIENSDQFLMTILEKSLSDDEQEHNHDMLGDDIFINEELINQMKDNVIDQPRREGGYQSAAGSRVGWTKHPKNPPKPLFARCSPKQVSSLGQRQVPLHVPGREDVHTHTFPRPLLNRKQVVERLNPKPRCQFYDSWLQRKKILQNEALNCLTLDDLQRIHRTCPPGQLNTTLQFNAIALRNIRACASSSFWRLLTGKTDQDLSLFSSSEHQDDKNLSMLSMAEHKASPTTRRHPSALL